MTQTLADVGNWQEKPEVIGDKSIHIDFIENSLPEWLVRSPLHRIGALKHARLEIPQWYKSASTDQHQAVASALKESWDSQNAIDEIVTSQESVYAFGKRLLQARLKSRYGIEEDVEQTFVRLYWRKGHIVHGFKIRTVSLLDAALHNFASSEVFHSDSMFITSPDARGHFDVKGATLGAMGIAQFVELCRNLDIGARHSRYLRSLLLPLDGLGERILQRKIIKSQKAAMSTAAHLALMKRDIDESAHAVVMGIINEQRNVYWAGKRISTYNLEMLGVVLSQIVVISATDRSSNHLDPVIAYVPHDPEHPLKMYPSGADFTGELIRQFRDKPAPGRQGTALSVTSAIQQPARAESYQHFFTQFVPHKQRGHFLALLNYRLRGIKWHEVQPGEGQPAWREEDIAQPNLEYKFHPFEADTENRFDGNVWPYLYRMSINRVLNDAREIAISTAYADRMARWDWWDNLEKLASQALNVALLVVTPFVPFLGELMMAYTAYQLTSDIIEGVMDLALGLGTEAAEHLVGVVESVVQLGMFAAGAEIGKLILPKLSPVIEQAIVVESPKGKKLWYPDLDPYTQRNLALPENSTPDELGMHRHQNKKILPLDGKHFELKDEPQTGHYRLQHPDRAEAYQPVVRHNANGALVIEGEKPRSWDEQTLMRRLGPTVAPFSDSELADIRAISGTDEGELRRIYTRNEPAPPLLEDTIKRYKVLEDIDLTKARIRAGQPMDPSSNWFAQLVTDFDGWPSDRALEVFQQSDLNGPSHKYGKADANADNTLRISLADVMNGQLPERVVNFLQEGELRALLGGEFSRDQQVQQLRNQLADHVEGRRGSVFNNIYRFRERPGNTNSRLVQREFPNLPRSVVEQVLARADATEQAVMANEGRMPLRLKNLARELEFEARAVRAYEGFYQDALFTPETEKLNLRALAVYSDALADLRIEIHSGTWDGPLRNSVGAEKASTLKHLVRDENGLYEVCDAQGRKLRDATDFFEAILYALPAQERAQLGLRPGQGPRLKQWLMEKLLPPTERRIALAEPPVRITPDLEDASLLKGPVYSKISKWHQDRVREQRLRALYPGHSPEELNAVVQALSTDTSITLEMLEQEKLQLASQLNGWERSFRDSGFWPETRRRFCAELLKAWESPSRVFRDETGYRRFGVRLQVPNVEMDLLLLEFPQLTANFRKVTSLNLSGRNFNQAHNAFLELFPKLEALGLAGNELERVPDAVAKLRNLQHLDLSSNQIALSAQDVAQLRELRRLRELRLNGNPQLTAVPDISQMPDLRELDLSGTSVQDWPVGLFASPRDQSFRLELNNTAIKHIPEVAPGSAKAETIARTRLDRKKLEFDDQARFADYRESVGLDPERTYEPKGDSSFWLEEVDVAEQPELQELWDSVEREHGSQGFFEVIKQLEESEHFETIEDQEAYEDNRDDLTRRVWRMLEAVSYDDVLRDRLFKNASFPGLCADGGAGIFNDMGIEVLASEHNRYFLPEQRELKQAVLAKGAARRKHLDEVIKGDIAHRIKPVAEGGLGQHFRGQMVDGVPERRGLLEVEIYLAYHTRLADALDLPWLSEHMTYRRQALVTQAQIAAAQETVLAMGEGDGLVNKMLLEPYWENCLKEQYSTQLQAYSERYDQQYESLDDLLSAHDDWINAQHQAPESNAQLKSRLETLALELSDLGVTQAEILSTEPISQTRSNELLNKLGYQRDELLRQLTRDALTRAKGVRNRD
ncbi:DUF6543 domain-containing protein [Pseudomonas sp. Sample_24]|uniref:dermonecrotic toxin domain-containing protein n=1 Tax=Pseudomonas sp. Sample_24 TaxID=2448268 RepID=UPI001032A80D|nr:DUF6543 domain-containing protein [Pseudomonas sp. Sample_24]